MKFPHREPISIDVITSLIIDRDAVICPAQSNSLRCLSKTKCIDRDVVMCPDQSKSLKRFKSDEA